MVASVQTWRAAVCPVAASLLRVVEALRAYSVVASVQTWRAAACPIAASVLRVVVGSAYSVVEAAVGRAGHTGRVVTSATEVACVWREQEFERLEV
jgi:hypothetical protein